MGNMKTDMQNDMQNEDTFDNMSQELCQVLKKNLFKILNPLMNEKIKTDEILLNFPLTKQLTAKVRELEEQIIEINCMKNLKIFSLNQKVEEQYNIINDLRNKLKSKNIKLEVNEINGNNLICNEDDVKSLNITDVENLKITKDIKLQEMQFEDSDDEVSNEINPFPEGSTSHNIYNINNSFPPVIKAPEEWVKLNKSAPQSIRDTYPHLNWTVTDKGCIASIEEEEEEENDSEEEVPEEVPEEVAEVPEEVAEVPEEVPEEVSEVAEEVAEEEVAEVPEEVAEEVPEEVPEEVAEEVAEEVPEEVPEEVSEEVPEEVSEEVPKVAEEVEEVVEEVTDEEEFEEVEVTDEEEFEEVEVTDEEEFEEVEVTDEEEFEKVEVTEEEVTDDDEELELEEIVIKKTKYLTDDPKNGNIYKCDLDGEIVEDEDGELIILGRFKNKKAKFNK